MGRFSSYLQKGFGVDLTNICGDGPTIHFTQPPIEGEVIFGVGNNLFVPYGHEMSRKVAQKIILIAHEKIGINQWVKAGDFACCCRCIR